MGSLTNFAETEILDHIFNGAGGAYTPPTTVYLALFTTDPGEAGTVTGEPSGNGYIRKAITFGAATSRSVTQSGQVTYDQASGSWGTIAYWGIMTLESGGNMLAYGAFTTGKSVVSGNTPSVASSEIVISAPANNGMSDYLANKVLDFLFRNQAFTGPSTYVALCTANPSDSSTGTTISEPSGNNYARKQVNATGGSSPTWESANSNAIQNANAITFNTPTGNWGTITAMALVDAATVGNMLFYEVDVTEQAPDTGDTVQIAAGGFDVTMD